MVATGKHEKHLTSAAVPSKGTPRSRRAATAPSVSAMTALEYQSVKACSRVCSFGLFACKRATSAVKHHAIAEINKAKAGQSIALPAGRAHCNKRNHAHAY